MGFSACEKHDSYAQYSINKHFKSFSHAVQFEISQVPFRNNLRFALHSLRTLKYHNYIHALTNSGEMQYFIVIEVKNLNTGQTREICTKSDFLDGAVLQELGSGFNSLIYLRLKKLEFINMQRHFEFRNISALNNIGFFDYSEDDFNTFEKTHNIDSLVMEIQRIGKWSLYQTDRITMLMYAHSLFNRGILTGEFTCSGGGYLNYVSNKWMHLQNEQMLKMKNITDSIENGD